VNTTILTNRRQLTERATNGGTQDFEEEEGVRKGKKTILWVSCSKARGGLLLDHDWREALLLETVEDVRGKNRREGKSF